jgi:hypothetical protein
MLVIGGPFSSLRPELRATYDPLGFVSLDAKLPLLAKPEFLLKVAAFIRLRIILGGTMNGIVPQVF